MRYFIIFYCIHFGKNASNYIHGNLSVSQVNYPNKKEWETYIYSDFKKYDKDGFARITNIIELNEPDSRSWNN